MTQKLKNPSYSCMYCKKELVGFNCNCIKKTYWKAFKGEKKK